MKKSGNKRRFCIGMLAVSLLTGSISGCAGMPESEKQPASAQVDPSDIELLEPVGVATNYDVAQFRNIYQVQVFSCVVSPAVTELEYTTDAPFEKYEKIPGEEVAPGDDLVVGDTAQLREAYEQLTEDIADKVRDHEDEISDLQEDLYDAKQNEYEVSAPYMDSLGWKPDENSPGYDMWARASLPAEAAYKEAVMAREKIEQSIKEKEELFALEKEYDQGCLQRIAEKVKESTISSNTAGTVVGINWYSQGDYIQKNSNVIAVGDSNQKVLHTEYISKSILSKAEDVYALIDGKRYEVTYEIMDKEEYARLKKLNDVVYSTFYLNDQENRVPMGKFATVVVVEESRENTLAVLSDALQKNGSDYYCYLFDGTDSVMQPVETGLSDGVYTEIVSGLENGDMVLTNKAITAKEKMCTLENGSVSGEYSGTGFLYYPSSEWMVNPAKTGTFYIREICVEQYQQVETGQMLARIEVVSDEISIARLERKMQRQQERLDRLLVKKSKIYSEEIDRSLERAIRSRQKAIADLSEDLDKLKQYSDEIILTAPYDGIITDVTSLKEGDLISYNQKLVQIADQTLCCMLVEDKEGQLSYGNEATITYIGGNNIKKSITGTVVSANRTALSKQLRTDYAMILISKEDIGDIAKLGSAINAGGDWNRSRFDIKVQIRSVDHVLLVPKQAVTVIHDKTYVKAKGEMGNITYVSFIAGGSDQKNYWVVEGLSEGMEICLE